MEVSGAKGAAQGLPRIRKGARITGDARDELARRVIDAYRSGVSIRALAESLGRSYGFVHGLLDEAGVPLRRRGGPTRGTRS